MSDYEPIPKPLLNQEARCECCEELCNAFAMIRCACGTFRCAKCSLKKCYCQLEKCIHNEHPRNCGICEDIHALENLVESLKIENSVLRKEVKAWRSMPRLDHIIGTYWEHGEDYMDALTDAKQVTDTLGLLKDKQ